MMQWSLRSRVESVGVYRFSLRPWQWLFLLPIRPFPQTSREGCHLLQTFSVHLIPEGLLPCSPSPLYASCPAQFVLAHAHLIHVLWFCCWDLPIQMLPLRGLWLCSVHCCCQAYGSEHLARNGIQLELIAFFCFHWIYFLKYLLFMTSDTILHLKQ